MTQETLKIINSYEREIKAFMRDGDFDLEEIGTSNYLKDALNKIEWFIVKHGCETIGELKLAIEVNHLSVELESLKNLIKEKLK